MRRSRPQRFSFQVHLARISYEFAIARFAGYKQRAVEQKTVSLEDLVDLLTTFDELADKRQAQCWSPTL